VKLIEARMADKKIQTLETKVKELQDQLAKVASSSPATQNQNSLISEIEKLKNIPTNLETKNKELQDTINNKNSDIQKLEKKLKDVEETGNKERKNSQDGDSSGWRKAAPITTRTSRELKTLQVDIEAAQAEYKELKAQKEQYLENINKLRNEEQKMKTDKDAIIVEVKALQKKKKKLKIYCKKQKILNQLTNY